MSNSIAKLFATFFGMGYSPFASGTTASIAGMLIYFVFCYNITIYLLIFVVITFLGFLTSGKVERLSNKKDPSCVVIDEVSGAMITFFMLPQIPSVLITAFFLFRAFDMFKVYPADKFEVFPGSMGIMLDDIVAGLYTNLVMHIVLSIKTGTLL